MELFQVKISLFRNFDFRPKDRVQNYYRNFEYSVLLFCLWSNLSESYNYAFDGPISF